MPRFACGKHRQLLSLLAQSGLPAAAHDAAAARPVTAGYWDGPQLPRF